MSRSVVGMIAGLLIAIAIMAGGALGLLLALVLGGVGLAIGAHLDGDVDLGELLRSRRR